MWCGVPRDPTAALGSADSLYPLRADQLPHVRLEHETLARWKAEAERCIDQVLFDRESWYYQFHGVQHSYRPLYNAHASRGCARLAEPEHDGCACPSSRRMEFLCRSELKMTLQDVITGLHCETTKDQRAVFAHLYPQLCVDGAIVRLYEGQTEHDAFRSVAIKWLALRSPTLKQLVSCRDFIYFEYCCTLRDADGRMVLVEYKISKEFQPGQLFDHPLDMPRGKTFVLSTYHMDGDVVIHHSNGYQDVPGSLPLRLAMSVTPVLFERDVNHYGLSDIKALRLVGVHAATLVPRRHDSATNCRVCQKKFSFRRLKRWCRACGYSMCRSCSIKLVLFQDNGLRSATRLPTVRECFCLGCLLYAREQASKHPGHHSVARVTNPTQHSGGIDSFFGTPLFAESSLDGLLDLYSTTASSGRPISELSHSGGGADGDLFFLSSSTNALDSDGSVSSSYTRSQSSAFYHSQEIVDMARGLATQAAHLRSIHEQREQDSGPVAFINLSDWQADEEEHVDEDGYEML